MNTHLKELKDKYELLNNSVLDREKSKDSLSEEKNNLASKNKDLEKLLLDQENKIKSLTTLLTELEGNKISNGNLVSELENKNSILKEEKVNIQSLLDKAEEKVSNFTNDRLTLIKENEELKEFYLSQGK